jgi:flagellar hook-associated protein 1 FlgK
MATIGSINQSLYTGVSGLQEVQTLLNTTSRNIVNAQTPGYVVKNQQAVSNAATGGVLAGPITRFISASLQQKARTNNADTTAAQARSAALTQMDQLSGNPTDGTSVSADVNTLQTAFQELAANPQAAGNGENILNDANNLALNLNEQTNALLGLQQTANSNIVDDVAQVNTDLQQIAELNKKVVAASANGQDPTDLQDQRDIAVDGLSKLMGINAFIDNQGVLQVLSSDFKPLAGLFSETVTYNQVNQTVSVSGQQINNVNGDIGGNLQVLTVDTVQRLQNLSEVADQVTSAFQGLPTSTIGLNGTLVSPAVAGADITAGVTKLITDNGSQYSATLAYRPVAGTTTYQLVIASMVPVQGAPAVTVPAYNGAANTGGIVIGTVDMSTVPPTFAGQNAQLTPTVPTTQPGTIPALTGYTTGLSTGATAVTPITANNTMTLFTQSDGSVPKTTLTLGGTLPAPAVEQFPDTAASAAFTLTTDLGHQYSATIAYRPVTPGVAGSGYQVVVTSLTPLNGAPTAGSLSYSAGTAGTAGSGGLVIGTFDTSSTPPTFQSTGRVTAIPAAGTTPQAFPGHIEPITANSTVTIGAISAPTGVSATNNVTNPYYSGDIQVSSSISLRALAVGDQFANTAADSNAGAAMAAASILNNGQFTFSTIGIGGTQTVGTAAGAITVGIGQDLANTKNSITGLTTAATQIQQAIAPQSEVNLDQQMSQLVVLQNAYSANARVVTTVNAMLDTLVNLVP